MDPDTHLGLLSLVPALMAVLLAFFTRDAIFSLLLACVAGVLIKGEGLLGVAGLFERALGNPRFVWVLLVEICIGVLVAFRWFRLHREPAALFSLAILLLCLIRGLTESFVILHPDNFSGFIALVVLLRLAVVQPLPDPQPGSATEVAIDHAVGLVDEADYDGPPMTTELWGR